MATVGNSLAVSQQVEMEFPCDPAVGSPSCILERIAHRASDTCRYVFAEALFLRAKRKTQAKCSSADTRGSKMWSLHTMEYYPAMERNEVLTHARTRVNPENVMLGERSQTDTKEPVRFAYRKSLEWAG